MLNTTIVALATPFMESAIAVIRLSGKDAIKIINELFQVMDDKKSDPYLVYALVASYRKLLSDNSEYAYEIKQIIEIKKNNPDL